MKVLFVLTLGLLLNFTVNAKIRRVGFTDVPAVAGVDYITFYQAHQAAAPGDTIYVWPGKVINSADWPTGYNWAEISKKLCIISKGNWLDSNSNPKGNYNYQASKGTGTVGGGSYYGDRYVYFKPGSEGSVISGFNCEDAMIRIQTRKITIKRNCFVGIYLDNVNADSIIIEENYKVYFRGNDNENNRFEGMWIKNNFISQMVLPTKSYKGTIENNVWAYDRTNNNNGGGSVMSIAPGYYGSWDFGQSQILLRYGTWLFQNNLIVCYYGSTVNESAFVITQGENSTFAFNVALASTNITSWPGTDMGNNKFIPVAQINSIFTAFPNISTATADARYQLSTTSPARAGSSLRPTATVDAGMFGGPNSYKLSTIPSIPTIYSISSPQGNSPTGPTIQVIISTRSNN